MGNDSSVLQKYDITRFYRRQDWLRLGHRGNHELWKHIYTLQTVEVHRLAENPSLKDMQIYEQRSKHQHLIKVYFLDATQEDNFCGTDKQMKLLVEHIPYRLNNVKKLSHNQALIVLQRTLQGFKILEKQFGVLISPEQELIGFNLQGKAKVWINVESSCNQLKPLEQPFDNKHLSHMYRISKLYALIERKIEGSLLPQHLKTTFFSKNISFELALILVTTYAQQNSLNLRVSQIREKLIDHNSLYSHTRKDAHASVDIRTSQINFTWNRSMSPKMPQKTCSIGNLHPTSPHKQVLVQKPIITQSKVSQNFSQIKVSTLPKITFSCSTVTPAKSILKHSQQILLLNQEDRREQVELKSQQKAELLNTYVHQATQTETSIHKVESKEQGIQALLEPKLKLSKIKITRVIDQRIEGKEKEPSKVPAEQGSIVEQIKKTKMNIVRVDSINQQFLVKKTGQEEQKQEEKKIAPKHTPKLRHTKDEIDFLDVNFLEKSLEVKFKNSLVETKKEPFEDDMLNINKLSQGLLKFEKTQQKVEEDIEQLHRQNANIQAKALELEHQLESQQETRTIFKQIQIQNPCSSSSIEALQTQIKPRNTSYTKHTKLLNHTRTTSDPNYQVASSYKPSENPIMSKRYRQQPIKSSWSGYDQTCGSPRVHSKDQIDSKYIKHVKSKQQLGPISEAVQHQQNGLNAAEIGKDRVNTTYQGQRAKILKTQHMSSSSKITYERLRSILKKDL